MNIAMRRHLNHFKNRTPSYKTFLMRWKPLQRQISQHWHVSAVNGPPKLPKMYLLHNDPTRIRLMMGVLQESSFVWNTPSYYTMVWSWQRFVCKDRPAATAARPMGIFTTVIKNTPPAYSGKMFSKFPVRLCKTLGRLNAHVIQY